MTEEQYWQAVLMFQLGTLPPDEARKYQVAGVSAECGARFKGTTLLPEEWFKPDVEPQDMPADVMVAVGINFLRMGGESV